MNYAQRRLIWRVLAICALAAIIANVIAACARFDTNGYYSTGPKKPRQHTEIRCYGALC